MSKKDTSVQPLRSDLPEWRALEAHAQEIKDITLNDLFKRDDNRFDDFHMQHDHILLDYSKQPITDKTMKLLAALADACDLDTWREKMFMGNAINTSENRAVLHTALRRGGKTGLSIDGRPIDNDIQDAQNKMKNICDELDASRQFKYIVNIGIGGSDLGLYMVYEALKPFSDRDYTVRYVSNIDGAHLSEVFRVIEPEQTIFVISSKTFTTQETMTNARSAKKWLQEQLGKEDVSDHFIAATGSPENARAFGVKENHIIPIWDWVGGRFSLWSAIGISYCIAIGFDNYKELLRGASSMDKHFRNTPHRENMPVLLALLGVWHRNFLKNDTLAIVPYDQYLKHFAGYIQQLDMESNGKSVDRDDRPIPYHTGPILIGETGTNAQHAFFQLIHQGTSIIPCDIIMNARPQNELGDHHELLLANGVAQTKALMEGREHENPHKAFEGNRPSNTIVLDELTPYTLGALLALYEHKIFVQGIIWNINSFDQCGVELGKEKYIRKNETQYTAPRQPPPYLAK